MWPKEGRLYYFIIFCTVGTFFFYNIKVKFGNENHQCSLPYTLPPSVFFRHSCPAPRPSSLRIAGSGPVSLGEVRRAPSEDSQAATLSLPHPVECGSGGVGVIGGKSLPRLAGSSDGIQVHCGAHPQQMETLRPLGLWHPVRVSTTRKEISFPCLGLTPLSR